jgi:diguanylate cyclase (GGDEF)-like protein
MSIFSRLHRRSTIHRTPRQCDSGRGESVGSSSHLWGMLSADSRWDMRTIMVIASAAGALPMLVIAVVSPTFLRPHAVPVLAVIVAFTALTVAVAVRSGRLTDSQFAVLGTGGMLGVTVSAYLISDPEGTRAVTAMLAIVPAIAASGSSRRVTAALTAAALTLATTLSAVSLESSGLGVSLVASGAAATTVIVPVLLIGGLRMSLSALTSRLRAANRELAEANTQLVTLAETDPLTGLLNRRGLLNRTTPLLFGVDNTVTDLQSAVGAPTETSRAGIGSPLIAHVVDIDDFKSVNDSFGHSAGDTAIVEVATALRSAVTEFDVPDAVVARTGGDEFLVLARHRPDRDLAQTILDQIRHHCAVTVSIGTVHLQKSSTCPPTDTHVFSNGSDVEGIVDTVMHAADEALYSAKAAGKNCNHDGGMADCLGNHITPRKVGF